VARFIGASHGGDQTTYSDFELYAAAWVWHGARGTETAQGIVPKGNPGALLQARLAGVYARRQKHNNQDPYRLTG